MARSMRRSLKVIAKKVLNNMGERLMIYKGKSISYKLPTGYASSVVDECAGAHGDEGITKKWKHQFLSGEIAGGFLLLYIFLHFLHFPQKQMVLLRKEAFTGM